MESEWRANGERADSVGTKADYNPIIIAVDE